MRTLIFSFLALATTLTTFARPQAGDDAYIFFNRDDTLYIQVIDHVGMGRGWDSVGERDRFFQFSKTLEKVFEETDFPLPYKIVRFGANRLPPDMPRLDVTIMKWGDNGMSEIEARLGASIRKSYDRNSLGIFTYRGGGTFGYQTGDRLRRVYNDVLSKALVKMARELNEHFPIGVSEDQSLLDDVGEGSPME